MTDLRNPERGSFISSNVTSGRASNGDEGSTIAKDAIFTRRPTPIPGPFLPRGGALKIKLVPGIARSVIFDSGPHIKLGTPPVQIAMKGSLPNPPLPIDWAKSLTFDNYGNDVYGDCMYTAAEHGDNTFTGNNSAESSFNTDETVRNYLRLSGGNNGLSSGAIIGEWRTGLNGVPAAKIMDALAIDTTNAALVQRAIWLFGGVFFTMSVPDAWLSIGSGGTWDAPATANPDNGHGVWWNGVDASGRYRLQTWGGYRWITTAGVSACDPGGFVVFSRRWFDANGKAPNGLTYDELASFWTQMGGKQLPPWPRSPAQGDRLKAGESLAQGGELKSADGRFRFIFQTDGNLVLYGPGHQAMWASGSDGHASAFIVAMQSDGNLVMYGGDNTVVWRTGTQGQGGAWLVVQDDGNAVLYDSSNHPIWATNTVVPASPAAPAQSDRLAAGEGLLAGHNLVSSDGRFYLALQSDSNLVVYGPANQKLWASNTDGKGSIWDLTMQSDGNLVVYDIRHNPIWASNTDGHGGAWAVLQNDGNLVVYGGDGRALWATNIVISSQPNSPTHPDRLLSGEGLIPGQSIKSANGKFTLAMQTDGNLVVYGPGNAPMWATQTDGHTDTAGVFMQYDGNLVIYGLHNTARWASGTVGKPGTSLVVQDNGNVVLYDSGNHAVWSTNTVAPPAPAAPTQKDRLLAGQGLMPGMSLTSNNGIFKLVFQADGNLVLYSYGHAIWATGTNGHMVWDAVMQPDGNLVVYDCHNKAVWATGTNGHPGSYFVLQDDTNLVVYSGQSALWASNTQGKR